jgi:hypothetical protein
VGSNYYYKCPVFNRHRYNPPFQRNAKYIITLSINCTSLPVRQFDGLSP